MIRRLLLLGLLALPVPLSAQAIALPEKPLDPPHAAVRDGYLILRDSLAGVTASIARLQRDLSQSSSYVLSSRARILQERCGAASRTLPSTRESFLRSPLMDSVPEPQRLMLRRHMDALETSLKACQQKFTAWTDRDKSEELRGYGVSTALKTADAIHRYDASANDVLRAINIRLRPLGAGPNPLAGGLDSPKRRSTREDSGRP